MSRGGARVWGSTGVACGVLTAFTLLAADTFRRTGWEQFPVGRHVVAAALITLVLGVAGGAAAALLGAAVARATARLGRGSSVGRDAAAALAWGGIAAAAIAPTAAWAFSGDRVRETPGARIGPWVLCLAAGAAVAVAALLARAARRALASGRRGKGAALLAPLMAGAIGAMVLDLTFFVALYGRLHTVLEAAAAGLAFTVYSVLAGTVWATSRGFRGFRRAITLHGAGWLVAFVAIAPLRRTITDALAHVWRSPAYLDRSLLRVAAAEAFLRHPGAWRGIAASRLAHVQERYDITTVALAPKWTEPPRPVPSPAAVDALRRKVRQPSVVFFYVDTLRQDVAYDARVMPAVSAFLDEALTFDRAYSAASDTLRSLPALVNGSFDLRPHRNGLQHLVVREQIPSKVFLAKSAAEFLEKLLPSFVFEERLVVSDYPSDAKDVWGYGADRSTALPLVDAALDWIAERDGRFFAWVFHFDVHNWRELRQEHVDEIASVHGLTNRDSPTFRYEAAVRGVDVSFARLRDGLARLGRGDDTIVVLVSDHGEALGRDGFWVHSIFLWESLVRVPLAIRIPGTRGRRIASPVSLVDVVPTLAPFLSPEGDRAGYHGEDLLAHAAGAAPPRRLPILLMATSQHILVRIGMVDDGRKLVLPVESGVPELHDVFAADPDAVDLSAAEPGRIPPMLSELVRSPVFPRGEVEGR